MTREEESVVVILVDDDFQTTTTSRFHTTASCRICHEEEEEEDSIVSCCCEKKKLEAPCACSGTAKYAHRECIQRWCDIKGDTTCEICLQKFEPDYTTSPPKMKEKADTIREENSSDEQDIIEDQTTILIETNECISAAERSASFCKTVAIMLTILLVARQLLAVLTEDSLDDNYPFSLLTIFGLRACGVVFPMYMIIHSLSALQHNIRRQRRLPLQVARRGRIGGNVDLDLGHVRVDIQSSSR